MLCWTGSSGFNSELLFTAISILSLGGGNTLTPIELCGKTVHVVVFHTHWGFCGVGLFQMTAVMRQEVLGLYRKIFRIAKKWQSASGQVEETTAEREYIIKEAKTLFRKNKDVSVCHCGFQFLTPFVVLCTLLVAGCQGMNIKNDFPDFLCHKCWYKHILRHIWVTVYYFRGDIW